MREEGDDSNVCSEAEEKDGEEVGTGDVLVKYERSNAPPKTPIFRPDAKVRLVALPIARRGRQPLPSILHIVERSNCLILDQEFVRKLWEELPRLTPVSA